MNRREKKKKKKKLQWELKNKTKQFLLLVRTLFTDVRSLNSIISKHDIDPKIPKLKMQITPL